jgi:hypothetical protein
MSKLRLLMCVVFGPLFFLNAFTQIDGSLYPPVANIISIHTKMVMDLPAGTSLENASIISYEYNAGANQFWCFYKKRKGYVILTPVSKKVLTVNNRDSTLVQQDFRNDKLQYWEILEDNNTLMIYNKATRLYITCLTEKDELILRPKRDGNTQKWFIIEPWDAEIRNKVKISRRIW